MDVTKTHGAFSWSELMTTDPAAAADYYAQLFGWSVETMDMGTGPYRVVKAGGASVAGIMAAPKEAGPMPPAWGCYVTVTDVDATVALCQKLGGTLCAPPMDVPGVGRMAVLQDPQGAVVNVITYASGG